MPAQLTFSQTYPLLKATIKAGHTPALIGDAGIGKSSLVEDLAREFKTKVFTLPVNQLADRADLTGVRMTQSDTGAWRQEAFPHQIIMDAVEYARNNKDEEPILFMDEFNRASSDITSSILSFQTLRRIGSIDFPDNLRLVVAGNDTGNVTGLDEASVSRFVVYRVKPDLDTFMQVQQLNPYIKDALSQNPDDLMAQIMVTNDAVDDDDDDANEDSQASFFSEFEGTDGNFQQVTRPRTITYVSQWLDEMGLDKSGSDAEREVLAGMFTDMSADDETNILMAGIQAHVGETSFAANLFNIIHSQFNSMLSASHTSGQPLASSLRPKQDVINQLSRAQDTQTVEAIINNMSEEEIANTLVWLAEAQNSKEVNNMNAVENFMANAPHQIDQLDNDSVRILMRLLSEASKVSAPAVKAMLNSTAPALDTWKMVIQSAVDVG